MRLASFNESFYTVRTEYRERLLLSFQLFHFAFYLASFSCSTGGVESKVGNKQWFATCFPWGFEQWEPFAATPKTEI